MNEIISAIEKADNIAIFPHVSLDGDALGTAISLFIALLKLGKKADVIVEEKIPRQFDFMPFVNKVKQFEDIRQMKYNLAIAVDSGDLKRLGNRIEIFNDADIKINIDHHTSNELYGDINFVDEGASACGELIYQLILELGVKIDKEMAICLYVSLATDTGSFRYSNTTAKTHDIAANLIRVGIPVNELSIHLFETHSIQKIKLMSQLFDNIKLYHEGKLLIAILTIENMQVTGADKDDTEGFANMLRGVEGVEVSALVSERKDGKHKISMRSKYYANVSEVAARYGGGGHIRAAGFESEMELESIKLLLVKEFEKLL